MNDTEKNGQNSTIIMANSGSRGNVAQFSQLLGMRGLMNKSSAYDQIGTKGDAKRKAGEKLGKAMNDDTIETPIKHSLVEGLTSTEYFNSCYGTRKAMADTAMKTSKSGYLTRKLVDSAQDIIVTTDDCGTTKGLLVKAIFNSDGVQIESLEERIKDRFSNQDIIDPKTGAVIVPIGELISPEQAKLIAASGIEEVEIRSVIHCNCEHGVCQKCFGKDLTTKKVVEIGTPIGVIAAQSIGEPATQLNMKSKQTGGSKGAGGNVAEGFKRLQQILDATPPKEYQLGTASHVKGVVEKIVNDGQTLVICVKNNTTGEEEKIEVKNSSSRDSLRIKEGMQVSYGDLITKNSSLDIKELLTFSGIEKCRHYIINEAQSVYRQQGIETSDKYLEIIVRQMTNKVKILNAGDSDLFVGKVIELSEFTKLNTDLLLKNKTPITALSLVLGLDSIPAHGKSFLSAASFQDSKKILTDAAVKRQTDFLFGLKENVMLGGLIPAGTAYKTSEEIIENGDKMYRKEY
jgi:DNA-directed RNA polymerase subunit beta'